MDVLGSEKISVKIYILGRLFMMDNKSIEGLSLWKIEKIYVDRE